MSRHLTGCAAFRSQSVHNHDDWIQQRHRRWDAGEMIDHYHVSSTEDKAGQDLASHPTATTQVEVGWAASDVGGRWSNRTVSANDDPDITDYLRATALIAHCATNDRAATKTALGEAKLERLVPLLRALDAAYRVVIEHFRTPEETQALDDEIRALTTTEGGDSWDTYNRYAARAIMAMRDEDRGAFNSVLEDVNRDYAPRRLIGAVADVYTKLLPELSTPTGEEFISNWIARITEFDNQRGNAAAN
jgi:hypothetical protein